MTMNVRKLEDVQVIYVKGVFMQNIFDYLEWRGDLSFHRDNFNEVDNLIFSILAYLEFQDIVPREAGKDSISLFKAAQ